MATSKWMPNFMKKKHVPKNKSISPVTVTVEIPHVSRPNTLELFKRNWPEIVKILPGILFMWTAGMELFWQTSIPYIKNHLTQYVILIVWVISVTLGALLAVIFIVKKVKVYTVYIAAAVLHLTPALAAFKELSESANSGRNFDSVIVLYVDVALPGLIYGLNFVTVFCYVVDYSTREFRGKLVKLICKASWLFTAVMKLFLPHDNKAAVIFKHCIYLSIAALVFITVFILTRTSFDKGLVKGETARKATESVESHRSQPSEHQSNGCNICTKDTIRPVTLVLGSRILSVLINNIPMLFAILWMTDASLMEIVQAKSDPTFACHVALGTKVVIGIGVILIPDCFTDCIDRIDCIVKIRDRRIYYIASIIFALLLIISHFARLVILRVVAILVHSIIGVGIDVISLKHLTKAFPLKGRSGLIAIVLIIETVFDTDLTATFTQYFGPTFQLPMAVGIAIVSVSLLICLPKKL